jgi:hypothetical protein
MRVNAAVSVHLVVNVSEEIIATDTMGEMKKKLEMAARELVIAANLTTGTHPVYVVKALSFEE